MKKDKVEMEKILETQRPVKIEEPESVVTSPPEEDKKIESDEPVKNIKDI